mmetsp:Transcript_23299/g.54100  ORF Transcript_23299/g.54100 Transcript_23299/m.54100 type:complete len:165 (+) Transcript_23299:106-600(+)|eukprot:CAMPEP_0116841754 /NCGR_PEP_ID=MMETSP0418-20121206/11125_1 /TAXON_ID=1158023 /ORGANISM="Astrosyne radiata, Strain 13vi08-1A" /LENGTH=164 /DNA_ID=CAMNT_0004472265 /DNA_START=102 /DNA_END=596 /DNA_ORIENTATION=-
MNIPKYGIVSLPIGKTKHRLHFEPCMDETDGILFTSNQSHPWSGNSHVELHAAYRWSMNKPADQEEAFVDVSLDDEPEEDFGDEISSEMNPSPRFFHSFDSESEDEDIPTYSNHGPIARRTIPHGFFRPVLKKVASDRNLFRTTRRLLETCHEVGRDKWRRNQS